MTATSTTRHPSGTGAYALSETIDAFRKALVEAGLSAPDHIKADGELHRYRAEGDKPGTRNAWYVLHADGLPAGAAGDWKRGHQVTWCAKGRDRLTAQDRAGIAALVEAAKRRERELQAARQQEAANRAGMLWDRCAPALFHAYLTRKGILPFGARINGAGDLVIPVGDDRGLWSLQFIKADGGKQFMPGGRVAGCWYRIDTGKRPGPLLICEGFATGCSLHMGTAAPVFCAFNAGNLLSVAKTIRRLNPRAELVICADNDAWTPGNPGLTAARTAALAVGAKLLVPDFTGLDLSSRPTDFNDLARLRREARQQQEVVA